MAKLFVIGNTIGEVHLPPHPSPPPGGCVLVPKMGFSAGGAAMNTAIQAARLGVSTGVAGVLGDDPLGLHIKSKLHEEKIDVNRLQLLANCNSPIRIVQTDPQGKPSYIYSPGTNEGYKLPEIVYRVPCKLFHLAAPELLTGAWPNKVVDIARNLKAARKTLTLDTFATGQGRDATLRHRKEHRHLLELVEIAFFNEQTAALISGRTERTSVVNYFHQLGVQIVVIRRGAEGALVSWSGGMKAVAAAKTKVVDTIGAKDAFTAGFLTGHLRGLDPVRSMALGCTVAGLCVRAQGALAGTANRAVVHKALAAYETKEKPKARARARSGAHDLTR